MAVSDSFLAFVLEQLGGVEHVTTRRMFGAVGLYSGTTFFGIVDNNTLYLKVNDETVGAFIDAGMGPFRPYPDQPEQAMTGYYAVPASVIEDGDELSAWARRSVAIGGAPKRRKKRR